MGLLHYLVVAFILTKYRPSALEVLSALLIGVGCIIQTEGDLYLDFSQFVVCIALCSFSALHSLLVAKEAGENQKVTVWDLTLAYGLVGSVLNLGIFLKSNSIQDLCAISLPIEGDCAQCLLMEFAGLSFALVYLHQALIAKTSPQTSIVTESTLEVA
jgi:hypothetical protein